MIDIRPTDDVQTLRRLGIAADLEPGGEGLERALGRWAAFDGERLVGGVALEDSDGLHLITWLWVAEDRRRRGIAGRLLDALEAEARRRGATELWATARSPAFFRARGFVAAAAGAERDRLLAGCRDCPQRGASCLPEVLVRRLGPDA